MEKFACANMGIDCDFVVTADTKEEVMQKAIEHGSVVHADLMVGWTAEQNAEFAKALMASIQTV